MILYCKAFKIPFLNCQVVELISRSMVPKLSGYGQFLVCLLATFYNHFIKNKTKQNKDKNCAPHRDSLCFNSLFYLPCYV